MGTDSLVFLVPVRREDRNKVLRRQALLLELPIRRNARVNEQGTVEKTVGMIVHEIALQEESAILRHLHKRIPRLLSVYGIRYNRHSTRADF